MKRFKRVAALGLTATMLLGSTVTAFADEGGASGSGDYEGYVERTSVFSVSVPTDASATKGFDFFVDPNGLLAETDYARLSGVTAADFESGATLFFERTPVAANEEAGTAAVVKYGKDSESIQFTNMSSYTVDVEVSASVTGADDITLGAVTAETTDPTIYLAIVAGEETEVINEEGATLTGTIAGEANNFEVQYKEADGDKPAGYFYVQKTATESAPLAAWKTFSFNLTGACGGTWNADQADVEPTVALTWKVTDPNAAPSGPSTTTTTYKKSETTGDVDVVFNYGSATAITGVKYSSDGETWNTYGNPSNYYSVNNADKTLTVKQSFINGLSATRYWRVYFDDSDTVYVDLTFSAE